MQITGGTRGLAPKRYLEEPRFLNELKPLFWANQEKEADAYDGLIYRLHPPGSAADCNHLLGFRGLGAVPALAKRENEQKVQKLVRTIRYPDVSAMIEAAGIEGLTLPKLTTVLHFHHPAFPIYSKALVEGLNALGIPAVFRDEISEESVFDYAGVIAALDRLKTSVTFENVPESNCFLTRVVEGALVEKARSGGLSR
ncbi:MAG TPA: hypothetical protein VM370_03325 [Candidatus Thermoplasmatota archaeon]|nr:hypothetical protein [Candidatus Thermoplasmatota archaeon]